MKPHGEAGGARFGEVSDEGNCSFALVDAEKHHSLFDIRMTSEGDEPQYADLSHQRVEFCTDAPDSTTASMTYHPPSQEDFGDREENVLQREHVYMQYAPPPEEVSSNANVPDNIDGHNEGSFAMSAQVSDNDREYEPEADGVRRSQRKNRKSSSNANGICPPPPMQPVAMVHWDNAADNRLQEIFPKSYAYQVPVTARSSVNYFLYQRWEKEQEFFMDKYEYWRAVSRNPKVPEREKPRLRRLVNQLAWLLHNSWNGMHEEDAPPEMLWRARKEEMRRLEQLLVRKQIIPPDADMSDPTLPRQQSPDNVQNPDISQTEEPDVEPKVSPSETETVKESPVKNVSQAKATPSQPSLKRKSLQQPRCMDVSFSGSTVSGSDAKKMRLQETPDEKPLAPKTPKPSHKKKPPIAKTPAMTKTASAKPGSSKKKSGKLYEIPPLGPDESQKSASLLVLVILFRRWSDVLKKLHCEVGPNSRLLCKEVETFLNEMQLLSKTLPKNLDSLYERQTALKKKLADNLLDYYYASWVLCDPAPLAPPKPEPKKPSTPRHSSQSTPKVPVDDAGFFMERRALEGILASEGNRYDIKDILAIEEFARKCTALNVAHIATAASDVVQLCEAYRELLNTPMPKTMADDRHASKRKSMRSLLTKLLDATRDEGSPLAEDPPRESKPIIKQVERPVNVKKVSTTPTNRNIANVENKTKPVRTSSTASHHVSPQVLAEGIAVHRAKRNAKPPSRFLFDDEEVDDKLRKPARSSPKAVERPVVQVKKPSPGVHTKANAAPAVSVAPPSSYMAAGTSRMEEFCIVNDDEEIGTAIIPCAEESYPEDMKLNENERRVILVQDTTRVSAEDIISFDDVELVEPVRRTRRDSSGRIYEAYKYMAHYYNGVSQQVSEKAYKEWINRRKAASTTNARNTGTTVGRSVMEVFAESSRPVVRRSIEHASANSVVEKRPGFTAESGAAEVNLQSKQKARSSIGTVSTTTSQPSDGNGEIARGRNESDKTGVESSGTSFETQSNSSDTNSAVNAEKAKELLSMVKPGSSMSSIKLQSQFDYLRMIVEKDFIQKTEETWLPIPDEGPLSESIKGVKAATARTKLLLKSPSASWDEYFTAKGSLEKLITKTVAEFKKASARSADDDIVFVPLKRDPDDVKTLPFLGHK